MFSRLSMPILAVTACALLAGCDEHATAPGPHALEIPWQTIARYDDSDTGHFDEIWASDSDDVFIASTQYTFNKIKDVRAEHFDGVEWTETSLPWTSGASDIWGSGPDDVYVAAGTLIHFDGVKWTALPMKALRVTGTAPDNVYIANSDVILRFSGANWDTLRTLDGAFPNSLAAAPDGTLFLGTDFEASIWNGTSWSAPAVLDNCVGPICAFSFADAYAHVSCFYNDFYHWDGQRWSFLKVPDDVIAISGTNATDVYAVGGSGTMLHRDDTHWTPLPRVTAQWLYRMSGTPSGVAVTGANSKVLWLKAGAATVLREANVLFTRFHIAAESADHFMLADDSSIYRYDAGKWREAPLPVPLSAWNVYALGGRSMGEMYAAMGDGVIARYDGTRWSREDSLAVPQTAFWVAPSGATYSIGGGGVYQRKGNWEQIESGSHLMYLISGDGGDGIITVARTDADPDHSTILDLDGNGWRTLPPPGDYVYSLWAGPGLDLYLAELGGLYHLRGNHYDRISAPDHRYDFVFGTSDGRVLAMSPQESGLFDGASFKLLAGRNPWQAVQAADGSIVAEVDQELVTWAP